MAETASNSPHGVPATGKFSQLSGPNPRRRAILGALALAPVAALPFVPAASGRTIEGKHEMFMKPVTASSNEAWSRWEAAVARFEAAEAARELAADVKDPIEMRFYDGKPINPVPSDMNVPAKDLTPHGLATKLAALAEWEAAVEAWRIESGLADAEERWDRAFDEHEAALRELLATPAPTLAMVAHKISLAEEIDLKDMAEPLLADLGRLG